MKAKTHLGKKIIGVTWVIPYLLIPLTFEDVNI